ncbi:MAG TPA: HD domain-containing phosphohydrolase [Methylococcaceae bacterium]|nr:HD domain-containing phosphohydrolase [Methylococcaceae bacterium]
MNDSASQPDVADTRETVLFVDDEQNILNALKRLFRAEGYRILTANGGAEGLEVFGQEHVDLVVSDMRMPGMSGAQFLEQVRLKWPDAVRILLTGYADMSSTIDAINKGQIFRYIAKPWEDNDIVLTVRQALERKRLEREKARLEELTHRQNEELAALNAGLEEKVRERTAELRRTMQQVELAHEKLKRNFFDSIRIFSSLMEMREGSMGGHSRRVADLSRRLAQRLGVADGEAQTIMLAALLHDIGKIGLPDHIIKQPFTNLSKADRAEFVKHPVKGEAALMGLEQLQDAAKLVRAHHERYDGRGYPDGMDGRNIPLGAAILGIVNDYDELVTGRLLAERLTPAEALAFIADASGRRYDPRVAETFVTLMGGVDDSVALRDIALSPRDLRSGMVLTRDVLAKDGLLLLSRDYVLNDKVIEQLHNYERSCEQHLVVHVNALEQ